MGVAGEPTAPGNRKGGAGFVLYRVTEAVGAWSMIDIFLVGILVALVRMDALATIRRYVRQCVGRG